MPQRAKAAAPKTAGTKKRPSSFAEMQERVEALEEPGGAWPGCYLQHQ
jgi:hypothetical protein